MSQLAFDEAPAAQMETLYRTRDVLRRRRLVREALEAAPASASWTSVVARLLPR
jgi:hypothetical protein